MKKLKNLLLKSEIPLALSVSQPYGYVSLLCGRYYVISTNAYVDYFPRVKSRETNNKTQNPLCS